MFVKHVRISFEPSNRGPCDIMRPSTAPSHLKLFCMTTFAEICGASSLGFPLPLFGVVRSIHRLCADEALSQQLLSWNACDWSRSFPVWSLVTLASWAISAAMLSRKHHPQLVLQGLPYKRTCCTSTSHDTGAWHAART